MSDSLAYYHLYQSPRYRTREPGRAAKALSAFRALFADNREKRRILRPSLPLYRRNILILSLSQCTFISLTFLAIWNFSYVYLTLYYSILYEILRNDTALI